MVQVYSPQVRSSFSPQKALSFFTVYIYIFFVFSGSLYNVNFCYRTAEKIKVVVYHVFRL